MDGFDKGSMIEYVLDMTGVDRKELGRVDVKGVYSFIDMPEQHLDKAAQAFEGEVYNGRKVRAELSGDGHVSSKRKSGDRKETSYRSGRKKENRGWGGGGKGTKKRAYR
jgi:ATP-dependent RNA helicase DeaD